MLVKLEGVALDLDLLACLGGQFRSVVNQVVTFTDKVWVTEGGFDRALLLARTNKRDNLMGELGQHLGDTLAVKVVEAAKG